MCLLEGPKCWEWLDMRGGSTLVQLLSFCPFVRIVGNRRVGRAPCQQPLRNLTAHCVTHRDWTHTPVLLPEGDGSRRVQVGGCIRLQGARGLDIALGHYLRLALTLFGVRVWALGWGYPTRIPNPNPNPSVRPLPSAVRVQRGPHPRAPLPPRLKGLRVRPPEGEPQLRPGAGVGGDGAPPPPIRIPLTMETLLLSVPSPVAPKGRTGAPLPL